MNAADVHETKGIKNTLPSSRGKRLVFVVDFVLLSSRQIKTFWNSMRLPIHFLIFGLSREGLGVAQENRYKWIIINLCRVIGIEIYLFIYSFEDAGGAIEEKDELAKENT